MSHRSPSSKKSRKENDRNKVIEELRNFSLSGDTHAVMTSARSRVSVYQLRSVRKIITMYGFPIEVEVHGDNDIYMIRTA